MRQLKLQPNLENNDPAKFGEMMVNSHQSLKHDYEVSCTELDILVDTAMGIEGVAGARMTGAGFGGCTINLVKRDALDNFTGIMEKEYRQKTGIKPDIYPVGITGELKRL